MLNTVIQEARRFTILVGDEQNGTNGSKTLIVESFSCSEGFSAVLSRFWRSTCFESRQLETKVQ